jgi:hypothetical protein
VFRKIQTTEHRKQMAACDEPIGREPFGRELRVERLRAERLSRVEDKVRLFSVT